MADTSLRIALTMRVTQAEGYEEPRDSIAEVWVSRLFDEWGHLPLLVPNLGDSAPAYVAGLAPDLLVLTGGEDVGVTPLRDRTETSLLDWALKVGVPVFGVCRGLQLANAEWGGGLSSIQGHVARDHAVRIAQPWHDFYDFETRVNSYHSIGIAPGALAEPLEATAFDEDGHIEAARHRERPFAAVMWHPERGPAKEGDRRLIEWLATQGAGQ